MPPRTTLLNGSMFLHGPRSSGKICYSDKRKPFIQVAVTVRDEYDASSLTVTATNLS